MSATKIERKIEKVLVANRGEIALRVFKTCRSLGIKTVAVYSDADRNSPHVQGADEAVYVGPAPSLSSYLKMDHIINAAKQTKADAIHPGYGFLSENSDFAQKCQENSIIFLGPRPNTMHMLGNKQAVKQLLTARCPQIPLIPGYNGDDQTLPTLSTEAKRVGFPLLIKAAAGGGGKGMRVVRAIDELEESLSAVKTEAHSAFGNDALLLERYFESCRHIEFQIFGDEYGQVIHFGERDCSVQRRYQKVVEETPSPFMTPALRQKMGEAAVTIGKLANYVGAGTVEFLVDQLTSQFYFLEVNTRLQVEHPITELVQHLDLVRLQIEVARGRSLQELNLLPPQRSEIVAQRTQQLMQNQQSPYVQDQIITHAIECRLYAEDPNNNFFPCIGQLLLYRPALAAGVRFDTGVDTGSVISVHYDPLIAKVITYGSSREMAIQRMITTLQKTVVLGLTTNQSFLINVLMHQSFRDGSYDTQFIPKYYSPETRLKIATPSEFDQRSLSLVATLFDWHRRQARRTAMRHIPAGWSNAYSMWQTTSFNLPNMGAKSPTIHVHYRNDYKHISCVAPSNTQAYSYGQPIPPTFSVVIDIDQDSKSIVPVGVNAPSVKNQSKSKNKNDNETAAPIIQATLLRVDLQVGVGEIEIEVNGHRRSFHVACDVAQWNSLEDDECLFYVHNFELGAHSILRKSRFVAAGEEKSSDGSFVVQAPIPCKIVEVAVKEGQQVKKGDVVVVIESMKMTMKLYASQSGQVHGVIAAGQIVKQNAPLLTITPPVTTAPPSS